MAKVSFAGHVLFPTSSTQAKGKVVKDRYKFFGEVALEKHFVTAEQLFEALTIQARRKVDGKMDKQLGQILLELGYIDADQISEVLDVLYPPVT